ncbi:hypothetical protein BC826DRAFT_1186828 [Russula brevipes]|nr:hypothetical protein BC826DRAFT_1186828 [Russula brevipes]
MNSDLYDAYSNPGPPPTESHISPASPHMRHMLRSATRREDWVLLVTHSPMGGPRHLQLQRHQPCRSPAVTGFASRRRSSGREGNNVGPSAASVPSRLFFPSLRPELPWSSAPESATPSTAGSGMGTGTPAVQSSRSSPAPYVDARSERTFLSWLPSKRAPLAPATAGGRSAQPVCGTTLPPWRRATTRIAAGPAAAAARHDADSARVHPPPN